MNNLLRKKGFTLIELIMVVAILGIIFSFSVNLLNTTDQEKRIFGQTCFNYITGKIKSFQLDTEYSRFSGFVLDNGSGSAYNVVQLNTYYFDNTAQSTINFLIYDENGQNEKLVESIPLLKDNDAGLGGRIPEVCRKGGFSVIANHYYQTGSSYVNRTTLPDGGVYISEIALPMHNISQPIFPWLNNGNRYLGTNWTGATTTPSYAVEEVRFYVCSNAGVATSPTPYEMHTVNGCIEFGNLIIDRRNKTISAQYCSKYNEDKSCADWPDPKGY